MKKLIIEWAELIAIFWLHICELHTEWLFDIFYIFLKIR